MTPGSGQPTPLPSPSHDDSQLNSTLCLCDHAFEPYAGALQSLKHGEWSSLGEMGPIGCRGSVRPSGCMQPTEVVISSASASQRFAALRSATPLYTRYFASLRIATQATDSRARWSAQEYGLDSLARTRWTSARPKTLPLLYFSAARHPAR